MSITAVVIVLWMCVQVLYCQGGESGKHDWEHHQSPNKEIMGESVEKDKAPMMALRYGAGPPCSKNEKMRASYLDVIVLQNHHHSRIIAIKE